MNNPYRFYYFVLGFVAGILLMVLAFGAISAVSAKEPPPPDFAPEAAKKELVVETTICRIETLVMNDLGVVFFNVTEDYQSLAWYMVLQNGITHEVKPPVEVLDPVYLDNLNAMVQESIIVRYNDLCLGIDR